MISTIASYSFYVKAAYAAAALTWALVLGVAYARYADAVRAAEPNDKTA